MCVITFSLYKPSKSFMNNISPIQIATPILDDYFPIISALPQIPPLPNATLQIHWLILYSKNYLFTQGEFLKYKRTKKRGPFTSRYLLHKRCLLNILCKVVFVLCLQWWTPRFTLSIYRFILKYGNSRFRIFHILSSYFVRTLTHIDYFLYRCWIIGQQTLVEWID